jgi:4-hydroxy-tetrahydrodipicolinate reductase
MADVLSGMPLRVAFYGAGQVSTNAAAILSRRAGFEVLGPFGREQRDDALRSGADVVVIATTSFLAAVADDVRDAVEAGSNVITTAEEAAYPWANDAAAADRLDALARSRGVTILGAGLNPGFAFDALVLTACGAVPEVESLVVERVVDLSGFGETVLRRIGVGHSPESFAEGCRNGSVTGHIGFPQSMRVVAARLGVTIDRIDRELEPIFAEDELAASSLTVEAGETGGFRQRYAAIRNGAVWFEALFIGHVDPRSIGQEPRDAISVHGPYGDLFLAATPGMNPQTSSSSIVANSIRRVIDAPPGWRTVADLPPAVPA